MIAFYYGLTGFACTWFFRHNLKTWKGILLAGVAPVAGGIMLLWVFVRSCIDLAQPGNSESGNSWLGVWTPAPLIAVLFLILGIVVMALQWRVSPAFFRRRAEIAPPEMTL